MPSPSAPMRLPEAWGHRGASHEYPENTLASFTAAVEHGAEGIESDVHITADSVVICAHDPSLDRTTNGSGLIKHQPYHGGIDRLLTTKAPPQPIPTFAQTIAWLCRPENAHVTFNIDVKVDNVPERIFGLMREIIEAQPDHATKLAPRLVLGLWHPGQIEPARRILPYCRLCHIGFSVPLAKRYFMRDCEAFSMAFACLVSREGELFRKECEANGKKLYVWTVNKRNEMIAATKWGVHAILTDKTDDLIKLREQMKADWTTVAKETTQWIVWTRVSYYLPYQFLYAAWYTFQMTQIGGPLLEPKTLDLEPTPPAERLQPLPIAA